MPIYFTNTQNCISNLKKIQKYFTRRLFNKVYGQVTRPHYSQKIKFLKLDPIKSYSIKADLALLYNSLNDLIDFSFKPTFSSPKQTRFIFQSTVSRTYRISLFHRSLALWNRFVSPKFDTIPIEHDAFSTFLSTNQFKCFFSVALLRLTLCAPH